MVLRAKTTAVSADPETAAALLRKSRPPEDAFNVAYLIYFTLGAGYQLPWNAFITAVDYFDHLYPDASVDRVFSVAYMVADLISILAMVWLARRWDSTARINLGYAVYLLSLVAIPAMDHGWIRGRVGVYGGYYLTVGVVGFCGLGDGLVCGVVGKAGELPARYMQALMAGTAASGVIVSVLRIFTKASYPQNAHGLRKSADLYFTVSIAVMLLNVLFYNLADKLPIIKYYADVKGEAVDEEKEQNRAEPQEIVGAVKWYGAGIAAIYIVTMSIFPGAVTEDVSSDALKDWYPILLIAAYNVCDLVGKELTPIYMMESEKAAIGASFGRLLLWPLFYGCLHGPGFLRTEVPATALTCLLGLTNGYFTSVLMILGPKTVPLQNAETAGLVLFLYLIAGLTIGSVLSWVWVL